MKTRREFFKTVAVAGAAGTLGLPLSATADATATDFTDDRRYWLSVLERISKPVLENLARRELKKNMPIEAANPNDRRRYSHLEAFGRLLAGIAPWLELAGLQGDESNRQSHWIGLTRAALDAATDPESPDFLNFKSGGQALVDTAFLAQAVLRAPQLLQKSLDAKLRVQLINALKASRAIGTPRGSNWVMFAAMVETALLEFGEPTLEERLEHCVRQMVSWYKGDGVYGDGERFHFDYYNSFVIQPMLVDVLEVLSRHDERFEPALRAIIHRAQRFAAVQERLIAPDGSYPAFGRSITYRFGAFQSLAQTALRQELSKPLNPAQVRCALTAVIRKQIEAAGTFDEDGWLRIGFCGHQPSLAEGYISTGSLYLCSAALLPLGLPESNPFWKNPAARWTSQRIWAGESLPPDHAMTEDPKFEIPSLRRNA
jgi:hypothetical protein